MSLRTPGPLERRFERLLDYVFWCGMEVFLLSLPVTVLLLGAPYPMYVALAASVSLVTCTAGVAAVRGRYLGLDPSGWPRFSDFHSLPFRAGYYGGAVATATFTGVEAALRVGAPWPLAVVSVAVATLALAALPQAFAATRRAARFWTFVG
ncbi:hypothetical protein ACFO0N_13995 [Halobium salinum]|uniref:DUF8215 domain-containing protein n=1 Tax=Halobium salinum TaxID=1364940 RepID=A0ABD5PDS5_9EURY|nr:hypothetical protein [Halobium salinum]